ncbi:hypothetical protein SCHPADRAFT_150463 [Schizopora paradoxa]|uniref:Uncharacterized protein n=1 Tax=Schizopora paradoxa TaxID=27342 RepID=A0A0H2S191_9AGAM|nr:hypothetical protein SCHPADRAFT_150463 [Schizopora paradoxa]
MDESVAPVRARGIRPDLDVTWELESEFASSDSDATTSGLIGPGRTLGLAYDWAGERVESRFRKFSLAQNVRTPKKNDNDNRSTDSLSTNATADNLPGPGRTLGLAFGWGGLHLEKRFNKLAEKFGYGPKAAEKKLEEFGRRYRDYVSSIQLGDWDSTKDPLEFLRGKLAKKAGKRLLKYTKSRVEATQVQALNGIIELCYKEPLLRDFFFDLSGLDVLQEVHASSDTDHLLASSRKALVFLSDAQVNTMFLEFRFKIDPPTIKQFAEMRRHLLFIIIFFNRCWAWWRRIPITRIGSRWTEPFLSQLLMRGTVMRRIH